MFRPWKDYGHDRNTVSFECQLIFWVNQKNILYSEKSDAQVNDSYEPVLFSKSKTHRATRLSGFDSYESVMFSESKAESGGQISLIPEQKTYEPILLSESKSYSTDREVWFQQERLLWTILFSESQILMNQLSVSLNKEVILCFVVLKACEDLNYCSFLLGVHTTIVKATQ